MGRNAGGDLRELLYELKQHPGPVLLSGYRNRLYDQELKYWHTESAKGSTFTGAIREEILWLNPDAISKRSPICSGVPS
jgi:DNA adenine methylase